MGTTMAGYTWHGLVINGQAVENAAANGVVFWRTTQYLFGSGTYIPTNSMEAAEILTATARDTNSFVIEANGTHNVVLIAIPVFKSIESIKTSNNERLYSRNKPQDGNFVLSETITTIPNETGQQKPYKVYIMKTVLPFSEGVKFFVNISE